MKTKTKTPAIMNTPVISMNRVNQDGEPRAIRLNKKSCMDEANVDDANVLHANEECEDENYYPND